MVVTTDDAIELMAESMGDLAKVVSQELKQERGSGHESINSRTSKSS
ncbi:MAG: hypothetical protein KAT90_04030 [Gammaproteobacteria bacterium]|nr:hypothetical protein [Gammaproteobacteria bacterium]